MLGAFGRRVLWFIVSLLQIFVIPITHIVNLRKGKKCPPPTNPILFHSATKLAAMIRNKEITSEEVIRAYIERCREVNVVLNAIVEPRYDAALCEAKNVDILIASNQKSSQELAEEFPLLGLPITVKESIAVSGMSNEAGRVRSGRTAASEDATVVRLARAAGAIPLLVSNTPELCMNWETYNNVTGCTNNPYDTKRTAGGSSGGEAALISSAASLIGLGSDIAGSLRLPAMFTGIYGHKPSPRAVCTSGHVPGCTDPEWDDYFSLGPMTRYAEDLPLILDVIKNSDVYKLSVKKEVDIKRIRFYYLDGNSHGINDRLSNDVNQAINKLKHYLKKEHGIEVQKMDIDNMKYIFELSAKLLLGIDGVENIYSKPEDASSWISIWPEFLKKLFGCSDSILPVVLYGPGKKINNLLSKQKMSKLKDLNNSLKEEITKILGNDGILIYPTFPSTAHLHYQIYCKFLNVSYLTAFNALGLPVTNCPLGLSAKGLPVGVQLVANKGNDYLTIGVAKEIEKGLGGWVPPNSNTKTV